MLIFQKIRWKNLLSTGNAWTEVTLDQNTDTLIIGENGTGKSTILDALCIALFNKPFRNINKPTLVNSINKADLLVEVEWKDGSNNYKVVRGIKPSVFEIYRNEKLINQDAKAKDYQEHLEKFILKFNFKSFTQVVILGSASFVPFMQLKAFERRSIVEDLLDIQIFSSMNNILKLRCDLNYNGLLSSDHETSITEAEYALKKKHFEELQKDKKKEFTENENRIKEVKSQILECEERIANNTTNIENLNDRLVEYETVDDDLSKHRKYHDGIESNILKFSKDLVFWSNTIICPMCEGSIDKSKAEGEVDKILNKKNESEKGILLLLEKIDRLKKRQNDRKEINDQIFSYNSHTTKNNSEIKIFNGLIEYYEKKKIELSNNQESLDNQKTSLDQLVEKLKRLDGTKKYLLEESEYLEVAGKLLKDNGIKTKIIKQYLPIINKLVNKYLAQMDFFVNFELNESFEETIKSRFRDEFSYENFSEGEKQRIDMALLLTWREVAKMKNSLATNILLLDEIFDSSMDGNGMDYLMNILHGLEKCNLFVISHRGDAIQDKFSNIVRFVKVGNYSRIEK